MPENYQNLEYLLLLSLVIIITGLLFSNKLFKHQHISISITLGAAIGAVFFISTLGLKIVDPQQFEWLMRGDWMQHFLGWYMFRHDAWALSEGQWIAGETYSISYPRGTSVGYTDSIPLFAFLFKPFQQWLPANFQYIGLWLFLCFVLQGVFAALLMRVLTRHLFLQALGIAFFVLSPVLLARIGHDALTAHWLLLAGLWLYMQPPAKLNVMWQWWMGLTLISALTHPYLTVMVLGLSVAAWWRLSLIDKQTGWFQALIRWSALPVLTLLAWWQSGYFMLSSGSDMSAEAPGYYSMNLLALINPSDWSVFLSPLPTATNGQYEGFNYLGAGTLILLIMALHEAVRKNISQKAFFTLLPLFVISTGFLFAALGPKITIGTATLLEWPELLFKPLAPFQSTARFFWPVNYLILFLILALLIKRNTTRSAIFLFMLALTFQLVDLHTKHQMCMYLRTAQWRTPLVSPIWDIATPHYQHITLLPSRYCGLPAGPDEPFLYLAGKYGLTLNSGSVARFDRVAAIKDCEDLTARIQAGKVEDSHLYIVHQDWLANFQRSAEKDLKCMEIDGFHACVTASSIEKWQQKL